MVNLENQTSDGRKNHMLSDSTSLVKILGSMRSSDDTRLSKLDVKEFYLMGSLRQFVDTTAVLSAVGGQEL